MIKKAAAFAEIAHKGAVRKGTNIPYITHPLETAVIASMLTDDEEIIAAALLHDTMEDAGVTYEELKERFGVRVANLVAEESEDKSRTWQERKSTTLRKLETAGMESKILTLADKLSNIRSMARDYLLKGEGLWERFNVKDKALHAWYYNSMKDRLRELEDTSQYQEYVELCAQVFGAAPMVRKQEEIKQEEKASDPAREIERSIIKKFRKEIWRPFVRALNEYDMIKEGDNIAVCISGGKDSMLLAKCMQEILRHGKMQFGLHFLVMDPGYNPENRRMIEDNARLMNIPVTIFESDIFNVVADVDESPCYLCARMRRGYLYANAKKLGCNKIALGHHFDDVIETILLSMLYGAQVNTMMPKLHSTNFEGMELIRPLYLVKEADILAWKEYNHLKFLQCACRFTEAAEAARGRDENHLSKRQEMKELINKFRQINPHIETNIFKSVENVNLDACIGYVRNGERHHFLEEY